MSSISLVDKLDENLFSDKIFKKFYNFYVFWFVLMPFVETGFHCVGLTFDLILQPMIISALFVLTKIFELIFNFKKISLKNKTIIDFLFFCLFIWFFISSSVSKAFNVKFFYGLSLFGCFYLFMNINKQYYAKIGLIFVLEMVFDSLLGIIDLNNCIIPGFNSECFAMSMQFLNPNWSGFVILIAEIICLWFIFKVNKNWQKTTLFTGFIVMTVGLFIGGSFAPETSLFLCELALIIYLWVKNKKCPLWILCAFLTTVLISFIVWLVPIWRIKSTAQANYFYETIAVIDNILNTNLLESISTFFNRIFGWDIVKFVAGSDGWDRSGLTREALIYIFATPKSFIFGYGAGYLYKIRVHNCFLALWLEFGFVSLLIYLTIIAFIVVRFIKIKKTDETVCLFALFLTMLFESLFCCIEPYNFIFFVMFSAVFYKKLYDSELKIKKESKEKLNKTAKE